MMAVPLVKWEMGHQGKALKGVWFMKTVLVYRAQDILIRQAVHNRLEENGIAVFGTDTSINVVYPNTPNLYLEGVSAVFEGYRVLVAEEHAHRAKALIEELEKELRDTPESTLNRREKNGVTFISGHQEDYLRRFQLFTLISLFIPVLPIPAAIYYFYKLRQSKQPAKLWKIYVLWMFLILSMGLGFFLYRNLF
jgi:hypothetical protein